MTKILKFLQVSLLIFGLFLVLVPVGKNVSVNAQGVTSSKPLTEACSKGYKNKKIQWADLFFINKFLPLIPQECGTNDKGEFAPLPLPFLFDIIIRTAGFLFSLAFYLLPVAIIVYGARVLFLPFDPKLNSNEFQEVTTAGRTITKELGQFLTGIIIILLAYTIVFTILGTLRIDGINTDLSEFFYT
jgi:hypothetical protein